MSGRSDRRDLANPPNRDKNFNYILSPPMLALKGIWDDYRVKRREHRRERKLALSNDSDIVRTVGTFTLTIPFTSRRKRAPYVTSALTSASVTENSSGTVNTTTQTELSGENGVISQDFAPRVPRIDATVELREMLEMNLGHLNRPDE